MSKIRVVLLFVVFGTLGVRAASAESGILLLAHGGSAEWNARH